MRARMIVYMHDTCMLHVQSDIDSESDENKNSKRADQSKKKRSGKKEKKTQKVCAFCVPCRPHIHTCMLCAEHRRQRKQQ